MNAVCPARSVGGLSLAGHCDEPSLQLVVMSQAPPEIDRSNLHHALVVRVPGLRHYVEQRIPKRLARSISSDDILQEVWIAAYRTVTRFEADGPEAIDRWLTKIANSKIVDAIRSARRTKRGGDRSSVSALRQQVTSCTDLFSEIQSRGKTPSSEARKAESAHAISIALNQLGPERRQAIYLRHIQGRSIKEIAEHMHKSEHAVRSLVYHGLMELRALLGDAAKYFSDIQPPDPDQVARTRGCRRPEAPDVSG
jgi:RNA polymerase sigma factor (sigma-70 family)